MSNGDLPRHSPRKRFGQHFLHDPAVVRRLVDTIGPGLEIALVEIGPGLGVLTRPLLQSVQRLDVVELDRDLAARLESDPACRPALRVHTADALNFDFCALAEERGRALTVVGNLPYNISTPLIFHLLDQSACIRDMLFMVQREVAERLAAAPGGGHYGRLSVMVQYRCRVERLFGVGPGAFNPPPKVESAVVRLTPQTPAPAARDEPALARLVRAAFSQRRKTLRNALRTLVSEEGIRAAGIDPRRRPETLSVAEFVQLTNALSD